MFYGFGTIINVVGIVGGGALGVFFGNRIPAKTRTLITDALGCVTMIAAVDALREIWNPGFIASLPKGWTVLTVLAALILGAIIGSLLRIETRLEAFGISLRSRFSRGEKSIFLEGFMAASLLFAIGHGAWNSAVGSQEHP